jgi:hypothetical protein
MLWFCFTLDYMTRTLLAHEMYKKALCIANAWISVGFYPVNIQSDLFWHRCLERQAFCTPRMYTLSPSKSITEILLKAALSTIQPTSQPTCLFQTHNLVLRRFTELQISCVFVFFTLWKRVKMHVLSDQSVHITHTYCCVSKLSKFGAYLYSCVHNNTFLSLRNSL